MFVSLQVSDGRGGRAAEVVSAWSTKTAGLVIARPARGDYSENLGRRYVVTHTASGLKVGRFWRTLREARAFAAALGREARGIDWTKPQAELLTRWVRDRARKAIERAELAAAEARS